MTKKYISLEHSIRNVIVESIGVGGSDKFQGNPAQFDKSYSSKKGGSSLAAARNASKTKISQTGIKPIEEKADEKKKNIDSKDNKSTIKMIETNPIVKFRSFPDLMTNPDGKAYPRLQPPQGMMAMTPPPQQQTMAPRDGPIPSTTPGAVATPQTIHKEGGSKNDEKSGASGAPLSGDTPISTGAAADAAPHLSAAAGVVAHLSQLLHHQSQAAAATPPPQQAATSAPPNPAPVLNEPNPKPAGNQKAQGNPIPQVPQNAPGMPSFQPPEGQTPAWMSKKGGLSANEKSPGVPSFQPPEKQVPAVMAKGPGSAMASPLAQAAAGYMDKAGPPSQAGSLHVAKAEPEKSVKKPDEKAPDKKEKPAEKSSEKEPSVLDRLLGKETQSQRDKYNADKDKGKVPDGPGHTNPGEKKKGGAFPIGGINRPEPTEADKYRDSSGPPPMGGKMSQMKTPEQVPSGDVGLKKRLDDIMSPIMGVPEKDRKTPENDVTPNQIKKTFSDFMSRIHGVKNPDAQQQHDTGQPVENKGPPTTPEVPDWVQKSGKYAAIIAGLIAAHKMGLFGSGGAGGGGGGGDPRYRKSDYAYPRIHGHDYSDDAQIQGSQTQRMKAASYFGPRTPKKFSIGGQQNEETDNTSERRKIEVLKRGAGTEERQKIEHTKRQHPNAKEGTKERRSVAYLERRPDEHDLRHRFSSKTLQGRETYAGMDEERRNFIMREAIADVKAKRKKTESGKKTPVDTKPMLNPEPLDSMRGP